MPIILSGKIGDSSVFHDISAALDGFLSTMPALPPIAWENKNFKPISDTLWLRPTNIQGETIVITDTKDETVGAYMVDVFAPSGQGKNEAIVMADIIADWMKQETIINYLDQTVRVTGANRGSIRNGENGWLQIAVEINYYALSERR